MFFFGQMKLRDKQVDRMLAKNGIAGARVFYSPVGVWFLFVALLGVAGLWIFLSVVVSLVGIMAVIVYLAMSFLLYTKRSHSFALTSEELFVLQPRFPFRLYQRYALTDVRLATFTAIRGSFLLRLFVFGDVYALRLELATGEVYTYACAGLQPDAFDENFTENTLDDPCNSLEAKGVPVHWPAGL